MAQDAKMGISVGTPTPDIDRQYFDLATQYYVAARWATFTVSGTVAGNLFHHAIELYLKGDLSRSVSRDELKEKYGHNLRRLWNAYKQKHSALSGFDRCIKTSTSFETIRYPDAVAEKGMFFAIPVSRPQPPLDFWAVGSKPPTYFVVVNDIDQLISILLTDSSLNPDFFFARLSTEAKAVLTATILLSWPPSKRLKLALPGQANENGVSEHSRVSPQLRRAPLSRD